MRKTSLLDRLEKLEQAQPGSSWQPPFVDSADYSSEAELNKALAEIEREARAAGWRPEHGIYVIILDTVRDENEPK